MIAVGISFAYLPHLPCLRSTMKIPVSMPMKILFVPSAMQIKPRGCPPLEICVSSSITLYFTHSSMPLIPARHDHIWMQLRNKPPSPPSSPFMSIGQNCPGKLPMTDSPCLRKSYLMTHLCCKVVKYSAFPIRRLGLRSSAYWCVILGVGALQAPVSDEYTLVHMPTTSACSLGRI